MYNRLINLLEEAHEKWLHYVDTCAFNQTALSITFEQMFADYLLANNVIVPPCEVGDTVYAEVCYLNGIHQFQITNITITQNKKGDWTKKYRAMRVVDGKLSTHKSILTFIISAKLSSLQEKRQKQS